MLRKNWIQCVAATLAALGMLAPNTPVVASGKPAVQRAAVAVVDVALNAAGELNGQVLDGAGAPVAGAQVTLRQGEQVAARTVSDDQGAFQLANLKGGVYHVAAGQQSAVYRVWPARTAPPAARDAILLVSDDAVRGQDGYIDPLSVAIVAGVVTTAILSGITLSRVNDIDDKVDKLKSK